VRRVLATNEKALHWVGSSKRDFLGFPEPVRDDMGNALGVAQFGGVAPNAKPWKGLGPGVLELVESNDGNAYRASIPFGSLRPCTCCTRFRRSLRLASGRPSETWISLNNASERRSETTRNTMAKRSADSLEITCGSKNDFEDLGDPDAV
jgi:hypothetical protein